MSVTGSPSGPVTSPENTTSAPSLSTAMPAAASSWTMSGSQEL